MKKILKSIALSSLLAVSLFASSQLSQNELNEIEKMPILAGSGIKVLKAHKVSDFYLLRANIQGNVQELVLTADKKHLIAGKVYDTKTGEELAIPNDVSVLKDKESLTYGTGKDVYYLFTDPECPYCKKFESYFPKIEKDVEIKVFFFPLSFHKNAVPLTHYILSKKTNAEKIKALLTIDADSKEFKNTKFTQAQIDNFNKKIDQDMQFADEFGVRGTPALFDIHGKSLSWVNVLQRYGVEVK